MLSKLIFVMNNATILHMISLIDKWHYCTNVISLTLLWPRYVMLICQCYGTSYMNNELIILCFRKWFSYGLKDYRSTIKDPMKNKKYPN